LVITSETPRRRRREVRKRYTPADLRVLTEDEARRFIPEGLGNPQADVALAWELLYRLEPELYDRLVSAERLHPDVLRWLRRDLGRIVEVGAGTGRLTLELSTHAREVIAIEPAEPLRCVLRRNLAEAEEGDRVRIAHGFFDELPVADDSADLVVACSAFTRDEGHGGEAGLAEMERVCRPGGSVVIVWPNNVRWLSARGYRYESFPGEMFVEFASPEEAVELTAIFYPGALSAVRRHGGRRVPFDLLGVNPPRDLSYKVLPR
jgi:SAM-dependent methyltransferase